MNKIDKLRIKDKACTVCDGIYPSGKTISKERCDNCIKNDKEFFNKRKEETNVRY